MSTEKGGMGDMGQGCRGAKDTLRETDSQRETRGATTAPGNLIKGLTLFSYIFSLGHNDTIVIVLLWRTNENLIK